jgi:Flp pilus assembly protein CpaB
MRITHRVGPGGPRTGARLVPFSPVAGFRPARRLNGRLTLAAGLAILSVLALLVGLSFVVPDTQTVLQATRDLPAGAIVQADDVMPVKVRLPETMAQTAYAGTAVDQVVGRRTGVRIAAGQLLGPTQFNVQHTSVAPGRVQVTISVDPYTASGGAIGPGDTVVVYASPRQQGGPLQPATVLVDQARVLAVGRADQPGAPAASGSSGASSSKPLWVTLDLDPQQGARITAAARTQYVDVEPLATAPDGGAP